MTTEIVSFKHLENALQVSISANAAVVSTRSVEIKSEVKSIAIALVAIAAIQRLGKCTIRIWKILLSS